METVYDEKTEYRIQQEFCRLKETCYLDHAAATLYSETQVKGIAEDLCQNLYGNPHSLNPSSKYCHDLIDRIRFKILNHFHTTSNEYSIIFTSGATGAIKLLLENFSWDDISEDGFSDTHPFNPGRSVYMYTESNHTSVVGGREIAAKNGIPFHSLSYEECLQAMEGRPRESPLLSGNSLFVYPAMCNFSGKKYPLSWLQKIQNGVLDSFGCEKPRNTKWFCLLDAAAFCASSELNLSMIKPDFVCVSFYKIFGYPTGLGALIVRNSSAHALDKKYYGGGTVEISISSENFHELRKVLHERFEDGTIPFLSILSLDHGFKTLNRLNLTMNVISRHVFSLAKYAFERLRELKHYNGRHVVEMYTDTEYKNAQTQGGIVNFNLKRSDGQYIGFVEVLNIANLNKIHIRTGCFCNTGACQRHLKLTNKDLKEHYHAGHVCGDAKDLINGRPTGSVRISFGYMSTSRDVNRLIDMITESFVESASPIPCLFTPKPDAVVKLKKIFTYPIKSCGAMEVQTWKINERGLEYDREWMIVTENGLCLTQKDNPRLSLVLPRLDLKLRKLIITFRTATPEDQVSIPLDYEYPQQGNDFDFCRSKVCGDHVQGHDCGDEAAEWLNRHLDRTDLRLIRQDKNDQRKSKTSKEENSEEKKLSLSNQAQYLLINNRSVDWLKCMIDPKEDVNPDTLVDRFRGNFLIDGVQELSESDWKRLLIGNVEFRVEGPCTRCQMICIDQHTGEKSRKPLVALSKALNGKIRFGIYLSHQNPNHNSVIQAGDAITVI